MRFVRRTLAPLLAGGLAAGALIAVADASPLPFSGVLAQDADDVADAESDPELDLDALIAEGTDFDTDSVFVDVATVGDLVQIFEYGKESVVENVAADLELVTTDEEDPDGDGPIVTRRDAAERYLLDRDCNGLLALGVRKQVSRPILATIYRPDEELLLQVDNFVSGAELPVGVDPISALPPEVIVGLLGDVHVPPLASQVPVGTMTVSVLDFDLIRARPPAMLKDLLSLSSGLASLLPDDQATADGFASPELYETVWADCLLEAAEEGTVPVGQTIGGQPAFTLKKDFPPEVVNTELTPDTDVVTWLEPDPALEVRIETTFESAFDDLNVNRFVDIPTQTWLETFTNTIEPGLEIAERVLTRATDVNKLLANEAFAAPGSFVYGEPVAGMEEQVRHALRAGEVDLEGLLQSVDPAAVAEAAAAEAALPPGSEADDEDGGSLADKVLDVVARPVFNPGDIEDTNELQFFDTPFPSEAGAFPQGFVQAIVWDPKYLNSDTFRDSWRAGIKQSSEWSFNYQETLDRGVYSGDKAEDLRDVLESLNVVDITLSLREGVYRADYITPCYSVTVSTLDIPTNNVIATESALAQLAQRDATFGDRFDIFDTAGPDMDTADLDYFLRHFLFNMGKALDEQADSGQYEGDVQSPELDDLDQDPALAYLNARDRNEQAREEQARAERAKADERRAALCSGENLRAHFTGEKVVDRNDNGVADDVERREDDAGTS